MEVPHSLRGAKGRHGQPPLLLHMFGWGGRFIRWSQHFDDISVASQILVDGDGRPPAGGDGLDDRSRPGGHIATGEDPIFGRGQGIGLDLDDVTPADG
jgi:hypothetical protein